MRIAAAQIAPVFLDRQATLAKIVAWCERAHAEGVELLAFPEALLPGYPVWLEHTGGARFDAPFQKLLYARYLDQSVELPGPELARLREVARDLGLGLVVGAVERGVKTGRGSLWCSALRIQPDGSWFSHRKLVPTYEERLVWARGDGFGLRVEGIHGWRVSVLNCWENWMPAARLALYAQGAELHVSLWPGTPENTRDISRFTAREGRVWVLAAAGLLRVEDIPSDVPGRAEMSSAALAGLLRSGGSRIVGPDGAERAALDEPREGLVTFDIDQETLAGERQNFDPAGHYHRPDVFQIRVDRTRQETVRFGETIEE